MFNGAFGTRPPPLINQSIDYYRPPQQSNWIRPDLPPATPFSLGGSSPFNGPILVDERYRFNATPASFGGGQESRVFDENFPNGTFNFCLRKNGWMTAHVFLIIRIFYEFFTVHKLVRRNNGRKFSLFDHLKLSIEVRDWVVDCLIDWLICLLLRWIDGLMDWLIDWLIDRNTRRIYILQLFSISSGSPAQWNSLQWPAATTASHGQPGGLSAVVRSKSLGSAAVLHKAVRERWKHHWWCYGLPIRVIRGARCVPLLHGKSLRTVAGPRSCQTSSLGQSWFPFWHLAQWRIT